MESQKNTGSWKYRMKMGLNFKRSFLQLWVMILTLMLTNHLQAKEQSTKNLSESELLDIVFKADINQEFIKKMLPLVEGDLKDLLQKAPSQRGIAAQQKWGCIYVPEKTWKQYVRLKGTLMKKAHELSEAEAEKVDHENDIAKAIAVKEAYSGNRGVILVQMMRAMKDPRERLLLLCIEYTSHGFGNGLMNTIAIEELIAPYAESMRLRKLRLAKENNEILAEGCKGPESVSVTGFSFNYFVNPDELKPGFKGLYSYVSRYRKPGYVVAAIKPGSPAAKSELKLGDVILGVEGQLFKDIPEEGKSFNPELMDKYIGNAIEKAETTGSAIFNIRRPISKEQTAFETSIHGKAMSVALKMSKVGGFSKTMPFNCTKSAAYAQSLAKYLAEDVEGVESPFNPQYFRSYTLLGLLSMGEAKYDKLVGKHIMKLVPESDTCPGTNCCTWTHTSSAIVLCEYYLRTKDERVKVGIERLYKILAAGQHAYYGSGHKCRGGDYNSSGMNITCANTLLSFALIKKCGVKVDDTRIEKSLAFLRNATEHGYIRYDGVSTYAEGKKLDYRYNGTQKAGSAARTALTAIAARLLGDDKYADELIRYTRHELGNEKDRFKHLAHVHGLPKMGMFWGFLALGGADEDALSEAMRAHVWLLQMSRRPGENSLYMYRRGGSRYLSTIYLLGINSRKHNLYVTGKSWWKPGYKVPLAKAESVSKK
ncbi:DUF6288 domain-containing protein [Rubritalea tangerina]|uniref:DUF6288 domain-containing protein n=1 Tax=Rubritalea tangerina TaxID=430798 RepID=A0ABW4ZBG7_9BACT